MKAEEHEQETLKQINPEGKIRVKDTTALSRFQRFLAEWMSR